MDSAKSDQLSSRRSFDYKSEMLQRGAFADIDAILSLIEDPDLRARATRLRADLAVSLAEASETVEVLASPRPSTSLAIAPPSRSRGRAALARMAARLLGRTKVRTGNRALVKALFDETYYIYRYQPVLVKGQRALDHYLTEGVLSGLSPHPMIDPDWYRSRRPDSSPSHFDLLLYLASPERFGDPVHPLFDAHFYLSQQPDVAAEGANPLAHYILFGWREQREPNAFFHSAWYLQEHPDVLESGMDPLTHYVRFGASEGRQPHPLFDRAYYIQQNPDVVTSALDDYTHYLLIGRSLGRSPNALVNEIADAVGFYPEAIIEALMRPSSVPRQIDHPLSLEVDPLPETLRRFIGLNYGARYIRRYAFLASLITRYSEKSPGAILSAEIGEMVNTISSASQDRARNQARNCDISIVIPVYNNIVHTVVAIASILGSDPKAAFEIIVADDASSDETPNVIKRIGGVVHLERNAVNIGFLRNCNSAARRVKSPVLVFLNNDVICMPGWLDALVAPLQDEKVGLTGSRLLFPDGTLQEAGGILWADGSASNFGRGSDASLPEFNYLKNVDYVSGASIAIRADLWRRLEGFDVSYSPAYCEDADLAFRIRSVGLRTVYQPLSTVIHHEGRSHGRDLHSGIKAYQVVNQARFRDRWKDVLARENLPPGADSFLARDRSRGKPHILIVDHYIPQWDRDAGSRTIYLYINLFIEAGFSVTFWPDNLRDDREYGDPLRQRGVEIITRRERRVNFADWIKENGQYINYFFLCRPHVSEKYIDHIRIFSKAKILYYGVDLHSARLRAAEALSPNSAARDEADDWERIERRICSRVDVAMYPGDREARIVKSWTPPNVQVIDFPIAFFSKAEIESAREDLTRRSTDSSYAMIFVGGFAHAPNVGAVIWFVKEVMPLLRAMESRFTLKIVGSKAPQSVMALAGSDVTFLGRLTDQELDALYRASGLAVVPLLFGAGVKGKVIEAMAKGVPLVMTSVGAQGLPGAETFAFVEDEAEAMAQTIVRVTQDPAEAVRRASLALDFIEEKFSSAAVRRLLTPFIPELSLMQTTD